MYFRVKIILKSNRYYTPRHPRRSISNHFSWYLHAYQALLYQIAMEMNFEVSIYALRALCTQINVLCMYYKLIFLLSNTWHFLYRRGSERVVAAIHDITNEAGCTCVTIQLEDRGAHNIRWGQRCDFHDVGPLTST